jgi:phosphoribosylamine--glycine ligase
VKVLVLGSGAREHALCVAVKRSRAVSQVLIAPGNALTALDAQNVPCAITDPNAVLQAVLAHGVDFVIVGPEAPLLAGVVDRLVGYGVPTLGPSQDAALLEGSKAHSKRAMIEAGVPTATHHAFKDLDACLEHMQVHPAPYVVKADGLMAGKGVIVCDDVEQSRAAANELFDGGQKQVVIERRLRGKEASLIALCDGFDYRLFPIARDHKRLLAGDKGKNTGGMGAFCPVVLSTEFEDRPVLSPEALAEKAIAPILAWQRRRGALYRGFLYAGLMFDEGRPYVLEYNARLGDPETQALLTALDGDLMPAFYAAAHGDFADAEWPEPVGAAVCVVLAAEGYPDAPKAGAKICGIEQAKAQPNVAVFGAGVTREGDAFVASGGRVLSVVAHGSTLGEAKQRAYAGVRCISFDGMQFRTDIAEPL